VSGHHSRSARLPGAPARGPERRASCRCFAGEIKALNEKGAVGTEDFLVEVPEVTVTDDSPAICVDETNRLSVVGKPGKHLRDPSGIDSGNCLSRLDESDIETMTAGVEREIRRLA